MRADPAVIRAYLGEEEDEALPAEVAKDLREKGLDRAVKPVTGERAP